MQRVSKAEFLRQSEGKHPTPLVVDLLGDVTTPVGAYWKLAHDEKYSFLLESVTGGETLARYSYLGVRPRTVIRTKDRTITRIEGDEILVNHLAEGKDPLDSLAEELHLRYETSRPDLPPFLGGAVGMLSYDLVRFFERLNNAPFDELNVDDLSMMITQTVVVFDHAKNLIRIIAMTDGTEASYDECQEELARIQDRLKGPLPPLPSESFEETVPEALVSQTEYEGYVHRMREYIEAGDGIQMVPSLRIRVEFQAHPLTLYRSLRSVNPSPYMFLLRFGDFDLVGASPELHASLHGSTATVRPIAGTRWRGQTPEEDDALAKELLSDEKERAEHIMLVDLGRNDLGRICEVGSVKVDELMVVERYSHVMHLASNVRGKLAKGKDAFDLIRATFPAGTVSGAPKIRAMQIIDELEQRRRGFYAGAVGTFSNNGDMDTCITLRSVLLKDGYAYVQAGAGIVFDSVPTKEYEECWNKARAALRAIALAQKGL